MKNNNQKICFCCNNPRNIKEFKTDRYCFRCFLIAKRLTYLTIGEFFKLLPINIWVPFEFIPDYKFELFSDYCQDKKYIEFNDNITLFRKIKK